MRRACATPCSMRQRPASTLASHESLPPFLTTDATHSPVHPTIRAMTAFCPPALYPRALTEILKNADHADRQGSDKVAATQSPPMLSQNELDGFLREAYHNKLMPGQCNRKGCTEPTGGLKVGGLSCDNPRAPPSCGAGVFGAAEPRVLRAGGVQSRQSNDLGEVGPPNEKFQSMESPVQSVQPP